MNFRTVFDVPGCVLLCNEKFPMVLSELSCGKGRLLFIRQKKAAANAAAKVRRWIKELQINVSEHRGDQSTIRLI